MNPAQKSKLDARQSTDRIGNLIRWLTRNRAAVGESERALAATLKMLTIRYRTIEQAVDDPPAIGLISETSRLREQMVGALTSPQAPSTEAELKNNEVEILRRLLVRGGAQLQAVPVRYSASPASQPPRDHPFRLGLLGLADLAAIMVGIHQICFPGRAPVQETMDRMGKIHREVGARVQPATIPGFGENEVLVLQDVLERLYPGALNLRLLAAANYWNDLAEVAAHIPDHERVRALSLLWNDQPELTALFKDMVTTLSQLGFAAEAFATREAVMERDAGSGWFVVHPASITSLEALQKLGAHGDDTVRIVGRYGHPAAVPRAVLAALLGEVCLHVPDGAMASLAAADVIDFPAVDLPVDLPLVPARRPGRKAAALAIADLVEVLAHVKARYLLDRATRRHAITSLVACVENGTPVSGLLHDAVADWVVCSHGDDPQQRERGRTRLFVVAEAADHPPGNATATAGAASALASGLSARVARNLAGELPWITEWTPGDAYPYTFTIRLDRPGDALASRSRKPAALLEATSPVSDVRTPALAMTPIATRADAQRLLDTLAGVSRQEVKERELRRHLGKLHKNVRARLLRYRNDPDPTELDDWRRSVAAVLRHRIEQLARQNRLGRLLSALTIHEDQLIAIYRRSEFAALDRRTSGEARPLLAHAAGSDKAVGALSAVPRTMSVSLAQEAVSHWLLSMRRQITVQAVLRELGLPAWVAEHLIDEIAAGAVRLGLVRRVAEVIEIFVARTHAGERAFAGVVGPVLHGFLERLDVDQARRSNALARHHAASAAPDAERPKTGNDGRAFGSTPFAEIWCEAFSRLIEANVAAAHEWSAGEASADLERLLSEFPQSRLEVEP